MVQAFSATRTMRPGSAGGAAGTLALSALVTFGSADAAMAGAHGGSHCQCTPSPSASVSPSPSPSATPASSDEGAGGGSSDEQSSSNDEGNVAGASTQASVSPAPSASPSTAPDGSGGLPDTGPAATFGGMAGAAGVSYAAYAYLRSKRRVQGALKSQQQK